MAGLDLQGGFGAGGAFDAARVMIAEQLRAEIEKNRVAMEEARRLEDARQANQRIAESARQFDVTQPIELGKLDVAKRQAGVAEGQLGETKRQFDFMSPLDAAVKTATAADITRRPEEAALDRAGALDLTKLRLRSQESEAGAGRLHDFDVLNRQGAQRLAQIAASGAQDRLTLQNKVNSGTAKDVSDLADMVVKNPDLLKDLPPTGRQAVLSEIARTHGDLQSSRRTAMKQMVAGALATLDELDPDKTAGFAGAVGTKGPSSLFGLLGEPISGTSARDYSRKVDQLKAQLTLPKLELMRGLGAMSEKEFGTVKDAVTALDRSMSEEQFKRELQNIRTGLGTAAQTFGIEITPKVSTGIERWEVGPDGKPRKVGG